MISSPKVKKEWNITSTPFTVLYEIQATIPVTQQQCIVWSSRSLLGSIKLLPEGAGAVSGTSSIIIGSRKATQSQGAMAKNPPAYDQVMAF
jgi:hypothetical protein